MRTKLVAGLVSAGILASGGTAAAVTTTAGTAQPAAATAATQAAGPGTPAPGAHAPGDHGPLQDLVTNGSITQAQATAVQNALMSYMRDHMPGIRNQVQQSHTPPVLQSGGPLATVLAQLVGNGTISQSQANAITSAITQQAKSHFSNGFRPGPGMMSGGPEASQ